MVPLGFVKSIPVAHHPAGHHHGGTYTLALKHGACRIQLELAAQRAKPAAVRLQERLQRVPLFGVRVSNHPLGRARRFECEETVLPGVCLWHWPLHVIPAA